MFSLIWPFEHADMILLVGQSFVSRISSTFQCFQSHFNKKLNTLVILGDFTAVLGGCRVILGGLWEVLDGCRVISSCSCVLLKVILGGPLVVWIVLGWFWTVLV